jgi:spore maturation protein SpmB
MQNENAKPVWILRGLLWGGFMFVIMEIVRPFADGIQLQTDKVLLKIILWLVAGLAYGFTVNLVEKRKS